MSEKTKRVHVDDDQVDDAVERIRAATETESRIVQLSDNSCMRIYENAVPIDSHEFKEFMTLCPAEKRQFKMYGKDATMQRYQRLYGSGVSYKFSGIVLHGDPVIPPVVRSCLEWTRRVFPMYEWNGALVNFYVNGNDYISAHSDDESDLEPGAPIVSFSFGSVRTFRIRDKKSKKRIVDVPTVSGSAICMMGEMQKEFTHEIPMEKTVHAPRINVTVRCFKKRSSN